ncbi:MAG: thiopurine S-methyltransferase [Woeseiaceae bacterium]|nr:thiopurine S-methyltransferase [Woeseiaceae bacterium]
MNENWLERWRQGRIGWHEADGNRSLRRHWRGSGLRVLVPLCGKSVDMLWLAEQGNDVTGVEVSDIAAREFFTDNHLRFERADGQRYRSTGLPITIVCGDYFEFDDCGFDAHYDRGALVALPAEHRSRYAAHTTARLSDDPVQLVITLEYEQDRAEGPPFSVNADELLAYWPSLTRIDAYDDIANAPPKFRDAGLAAMTEVVWRSG